MGVEMNRLVRGGLAGMVATIPMTLVIAAGRGAGLLRTPPPKQITAEVEEAVGSDASRAEDGFTARWMAAHVGYGVACGALYVAARPLFPRSPMRAGVLYGVGVWAGSYGGLMPLLGLYPRLDEDDHSRTAVMLAAHAVFGAALATASPRLGATAT